MRKSGKAPASEAPFSSRQSGGAFEPESLSVASSVQRRESSTPLLPAQTHFQSTGKALGGRRRRSRLLVTWGFRLLLLVVVLGYAGVS